MTKKLLFTFLMVFKLSIVFAQFDNISIIGQFTNWSVDVPLNTTDGITYTLTAQNFAVTGGAKFRKDNAWTTNWGSTSFPTGTGTLNGLDIPVPAGTYNVVFNKNTGAYTFTAVQSTYDNIGIIGGFNAWAESLPLTTFDGVLYTRDDYNFTANNVKFRKDNNWTVNWGGTTFPSGTAILGGSDIPLTSGFYNVAFNYNQLNYTFVQVPVTLIGSGAQGWDTDVSLNTNDGGVTFTLENVSLVNGLVKFRANGSWAKNWGSADFPSGTGTQNGADIPTSAGNYNITFNRTTGAYNFQQVLSVTENQLLNIKVYPNPSNTFWNFSSPKEIIDRIEISDLTGKTIFSSQFTSNEVVVDSSTFSKGIFLAKVTGNNVTQTVKLVKN
ncbi:T9SS type A sorting domain-containing protein [Flavobacterium sp. UBA6135]|uniref:T9SS type A sorting domain-containing protein n=1 Tax=Flavobacterium sp. UBA6135 TaxID=1946553 RepID=UPI0025BFDF87|nr:T9SS type A sorting domain-containing protein [Flavobacterium sp. UBA6135]